MLVGLETFQDCLLYRSMFIRLIESLLMVEECRPRHTCRREEICQAVLRGEEDDRLDFQACPWFLKSRNFFR